jgi:hypothetical protein
MTQPHVPPSAAETSTTTAPAAATLTPAPLVTSAFLILCGSQLAFFSSDRMLWVVLPLHLQDLGLDYAAMFVSQCWSPRVYAAIFGICSPLFVWPVCLTALYVTAEGNNERERKE